MNKSFLFVTVNMYLVPHYFVLSHIYDLDLSLPVAVELLNELCIFIESVLVDGAET